jgi:hypothetical protein
VRFPADQLQRIRAGAITVALRPWERRPTAYRPGGIYSLERVEDVRNEHEVPELIGAAGEEWKTVVEYERQVIDTGESIEIVSAFHRLANGEPALLDTLPPAIVEASGHESLEELVDDFRAERGGPAYQHVWVLHFRYGGDRARFLGMPGIGGATRTFRGKRKPGHGDYVSSAVHAIDPLEAIDAATLEDYVDEAHRGDVSRAAKRRAEWEAQLLSARLAALESMSALNPRKLARVRSAIEDLERDARRRAA